MRTKSLLATAPTLKLAWQEARDRGWVRTSALSRRQEKKGTRKAGGTPWEGVGGVNAERCMERDASEIMGGEYIVQETMVVQRFEVPINMTCMERYGHRDRIW